MCVCVGPLSLAYRDVFDGLPGPEGLGLAADVRVPQLGNILADEGQPFSFE